MRRGIGLGLQLDLYRSLGPRLDGIYGAVTVAPGKTD